MSAEMSAAACDSRRCDLGEGPFWHPERGQLFWFDIIGHRLHSIEGGQPRDWPMGEFTSAAGWFDRDRLMVVSETGFYRFDLATGTRELILPLEADRPETRSNDGRTDPMGGFWIGTMGKQAEPGAGAIYRLYRGELRKLHDAISIPNAICFSGDGRTGYWTDTPTQKIMRQSLDAEGWPDAPAEVLVDLEPEGLYPDGAVTDAEDGIWCAQWGAGQVARYTSDGAFDRAIPVAGRHTTCPVFGGDTLDRLYITTAREGIDRPDDAQGLLYQAMPGLRGRADPPLRID